MRRYGKWAGRPLGMDEKPAYCIVEVRIGSWIRQCNLSRNGPDNLCGTHRRMLQAGYSLCIPVEEPPQ